MYFQNSNQKEIIECLVNGVNRKEKFPEVFRRFCLTLHFHSPRAYEFVREIFDKHLPHSSTIRSWYANSNVNAKPNELSDDILNILSAKSEEMLESGSKLILAIKWDEAYLKKNVQYSVAQQKLVGYSFCDGNKRQDKSEPEIANQALVFYVTAINTKFEMPIAHYFISAMNAVQKKNLVQNIVEQIIDRGIIVCSITFDGFRANKTVCQLFGAELNVYSPQFKPHFPLKGQTIHIFFDACHMIKLVRNRLGIKKILIDGENNEIKWNYFEDLVDMDTCRLAVIHKMTKTHIDFHRKKMKVDLAVQTLSASVAASFELLIEMDVVQFLDAQSTAKFTRIFNNLFDIFNTKTGESDNPFKRILSIENFVQIFDFFDTTIEYIKALKICNEKGNLIKVCNSNVNTGFSGWVINMISLKFLFQDFVTEREILKSIRTFDLLQDQLELFFGKIRALGGSNDNPICEQFSAAFRKLLAYSTVMYSKYSNCKVTEDSPSSNPYVNILSVTSRRPQTNKNDFEKYSDITEDQIEGLYNKLAEIEENHSNESVEIFSDYTIAYIANLIEERAKAKLKCALCKNIFDENVCKADMFEGTKYNARPCYSTFVICKQSSRFLKEELIKSDVDMKVIHSEIFQLLNFASLFDLTDFSQHSDHKEYFVRYIINEFIKIEATNIAKKVTLKEHEKSLRVKLHKLMHFLGH